VVTAGIDVGGTKLLGVAVDGAGEVVAERRSPTPAGAAELLDAVAALAGELAADAGPPSAVGAGVPGLVRRDGVLAVAPNLPGVVHLDVRAELAARLGVPVQVDNDATCAMWAEHRLGAARGATDAVLVTLGTGIGGGVVAGGRLVRGAHGFAGELGHMVVDPAGPACPCGRRGCWETVASGGGLGRLARRAAVAGRAVRALALAGGDPDAVTGEHLTAAAAEGDAEARALMAEFAGWVALGLANLANALDPAVLVLGGGLVEAGEVLLGPVRAALGGGVLGGVVPGNGERSLAVVPAALGERAGAVGAALLAAGDGA